MANQVDDPSPLITYSTSDWYPGTNASLQCFQNTYTFSNTSGAKASFTFNGTGISIFGSTGPSNAPFSVQIDGGDPVRLKNTTSPSSSCQAPLYSIDTLSHNTHTISITNEAVDPDENILNLDYIQVQMPPSSSNDQLTSHVLPAQSTSSSSYNFSGPGWNSVGNNPSLQMGTGLFTSNPGDSFSIQFNVSTSIILFGAVCPTCGSYRVQVDDGPAFTYNSSNPSAHASQVLFYGSNYDRGLHLLNVSKTDPDNETVFIVDHAQIELSLDAAGSNGQITTSSADPEPANAPTSMSPKSSGPSPALIGGLCAALAVALLIFGTSLILYRRRKINHTSSSEKDSLGKIEAFYIDVDKEVRSRSRHAHTRSSNSLQSSRHHSANSSRTGVHDMNSPGPVQSARSHRTPRQSNVSANNSRRSDASRDGPPRRRRTLRNSRILRAGYNLFFASPGSSVSGSNLAPTTVFTTTISERPPTTLSPVSEVPPSLPPSIRSSITPRPESAQRLHVVNLSDD